jgi:hypothetical protein
MKYIIATAFLLACLANAQDTAQTVKDTLRQARRDTDADMKAACTYDVVPKETPEHKYSRLKCETAVALYFKRRGEQDEAETTEAPYAEQILRVQFISQAANVVYDWRARMRHADECKTLYAQTINKVVSALTMKEDGAIKACKALDSYPPPKE